MNFFTQLANLGQGIDVLLRIKSKNGKLTIAVEPQLTNASRLKPLVLTGTPEEMDDGFIGQFDGVVSVAKGLESNLAEVRKDAEQLATEAKAKPQTKEKGKAPVAMPEKAAKKKPETKKPAKPVKPEPVPGDMFEQPAVVDKAGEPLADPDPQENAAGEPSSESE